MKALITGINGMDGSHAPCKIKIERGVYHKFVLEIGSVLLCVTTAKFDINDEIK